MTEGDWDAPPLTVPKSTVELSAEAFDRIEPWLRGLLGDRAGLLDVEPRPEHLLVIRNVEDLFLEYRTETAATEAIALLAEVTIAGGRISPDDHRGDVPWCSMLVQVADRPKLGSRAARGWFSHLYRAGFMGDECSGIAMGVAAYAVAAFEQRLGRTHEAARWLEAASAQTEDMEPAAIGLAVVVRASGLLAPVLRETRSRVER
jgi:hypothetical protein